jgi:uncharacterized protein YgfB (UPF0149 family)
VHLTALFDGALAGRNIPDQERRNDDDAQQALRLLYADTLNALRGEDMEFEVLLPDDDIPLETRAGGLSQWCQGFLYGFGTGQADQQAHEQTGQPAGKRAVKHDELPGSVNEILNDLTHIGRASVELDGDGEGGSESEEEAYAEVVEYVRVGVQLIHDELIPTTAHRMPLDDAAPGPGDLDDSQDLDPTTLH